MDLHAFQIFKNYIEKLNPKMRSNKSTLHHEPLGHHRIVRHVPSQKDGGHVDVQDSPQEDFFQR
jgi:hypothetical protein